MKALKDAHVFAGKERAETDSERGGQRSGRGIMDPLYGKWKN